MVISMTAKTDVKQEIKPVIPDANQAEGETTPRSTGVLLQARELTIRTRAGENILSDISFHIEPGELVALTGMSGSGKSRLLQTLAGLSEPASGEVLIDSVSLYANRKAYHPAIGYVPAEYPLPQNLTVEEVLQESATLRLPRRVTSRERKERNMNLLQAVGLTQVRDRRVSSLSKYEKRKLSIAVELIGSPGLLLIDGSAERLAPFEEVQIIILLRELSRQGITIMMINERSRSAGLADKIIFLAPGGRLAWFGPAEETFAYLKELLPRGVVKDLFGLQEALEVLVNPQPRDGVVWAKRFKDSPAYMKNVDDPLHNRYPDLLLQTRPLLRLRLRNSAKEKLPPPMVPRAGGFQKLVLLLRRNFRLLWRDRMGWRMITIPALVALVTLVLASTTTLGTSLADLNRPPVVPGLLGFLVVLTAAFLVQNEIFKDRPVFRRESRTSPMLISYVLSKVWLVGLLALYQGLVWAVVLFFAGTGTAAGTAAFLPYGISLFLLAFMGGVLGLIVSALSRTAMTTSGWALLLTVPQLLLILSPSNYWLTLAGMSIGLMLLLLFIQRATGDART
jgi:ABC-type multidrug transport system ATPase subunit